MYACIVIKSTVHTAKTELSIQVDVGKLPGMQIAILTCISQVIVSYALIAQVVLDRLLLILLQIVIYFNKCRK
jgi:hypothetical protein